jgi:hypothetical protein
MFQINSKHTHHGTTEFGDYIKERRKIMYNQATVNKFNNITTITSGTVNNKAYDANIPIAHGTVWGTKTWGLPVVPENCQEKWGSRAEGLAIVKYAKETLFEEDYVEGKLGYQSTFYPFAKTIKQKCDVILGTEVSREEALDEITKNNLGEVNSGRTREMGSSTRCTAGSTDCIKKEVARYLKNCHNSLQTDCASAALAGQECEGNDEDILFNANSIEFADVTLQCTDNLMEYFADEKPTYPGVPTGAPKIPQSLLNNGEVVSIENYYSCASLDNELQENCHRGYLGLESNTVQGTVPQNFGDSGNGNIDDAVDGLNQESGGISDAESSQDSDDDKAEEKQQTVLALGAFIIGLAVVYSL